MYGEASRPERIARAISRRSPSEIFWKRPVMARLPEKLDSKVIDGPDDESAVEEIVLLLAGCLGDQQTAVAGGAMEEPPLVGVLRLMLGTDRIVGTQLAEYQGISDMPMDAAAHLDEPAQRPLSVGSACVEQDAVADARQRVDPLPDRTGRITAFEGHGGDQQMREGMKHQVRQPKNFR